MNYDQRLLTYLTGRRMRERKGKERKGKDKFIMGIRKMTPTIVQFSTQLSPLSVASSLWGVNTCFH